MDDINFIKEMFEKYQDKFKLLFKHINNPYIFKTILYWGSWHIDRFRPLNSSINVYEMVFLHKLVKIFKCYNCLEIGFATGVSAMTILNSIGKLLLKNPKKHGQLTSIDPFQVSAWHSYGKHNANVIVEQYQDRNVNLEHHLIETTSDPALQRLIDDKKQYDMIFIDGGHDYETVKYDIEKSHQLIKNFGIIILDDVRHFDVKKALKEFLEHNKTWHRISITKENKISYKKPDESKYNNPVTMFAYQVQKTKK